MQLSEAARASTPRGAPHAADLRRLLAPASADELYMHLSRWASERDMTRDMLASHSVWLAGFRDSLTRAAQGPSRLDYLNPWPRGLAGGAKLPNPALGGAATFPGAMGAAAPPPGLGGAGAPLRLPLNDTQELLIAVRARGGT